MRRTCGSAPPVTFGTLTGSPLARSKRAAGTMVQRWISSLARKPRAIFSAASSLSRAGEQVLHRGVDPLPRRERPPGQVLDRLLGGAPGIVGHPGAEADLDQHVEVVGQRRVDGEVLDHRVGKGAGGGLLQLLGRELRIDGVDVEGPHRIQVMPRCWRISSLTRSPRASRTPSFRPTTILQGMEFSFDSRLATLLQQAQGKSLYFDWLSGKS